MVPLSNFVFDKYGQVFTLTISPVRFKDAGTYKCNNIKLFNIVVVGVPTCSPRADLVEFQVKSWIQKTTYFYKILKKALKTYETICNFVPTWNKWAVILFHWISLTMGFFFWWGTLYSSSVHHQFCPIALPGSFAVILVVVLVIVVVVVVILLFSTLSSKGFSFCS